MRNLDTVIPPCASLPLTSSTGALTAIELGCVSTTTAGQTSAPAAWHLTNLPHPFERRW